MNASLVYTDHGLANNLKELGKQGDKITAKIVGRTARFYRAYVKKNYLSGQMLGSRTGQTKKRMIVYKKKGSKATYVIGQKGFSTNSQTGTKLSNIYEHAGGYTIVPKNKKALRFEINGQEIIVKKVQGRQRPFMSQSSNSFNFSRSFDESAAEVIPAEFAKLGIEVAQ